LRSITSLALVVGLALGGCGGGSESIAGEGTEQSALLGGDISGADEDGVVHVRIATDGGYRRCSGTLVAKNVLITAQHCVSNFAEGTFTCSPAGDLISTGSAGEIGALLEPSSVGVRVGSEVDIDAPPDAVGVRIVAVQTTTICKSDLAAVILDREIDGVPILPVRLTGSVEPGDPLRVVGYGTPAIDVRHTRDGVPVARVGDNEFRPDGEAIAPRTFQTDGPTLCSGDSGGPAFAASGALVGVFSLVVGECDSARARNVFTLVSAFAENVLEPAFEAAGATPIPEPGVGGSGGTASTEGGAAGEGASPSIGGSGASPGVSGSGPGVSGAGGAVGGAAGDAGTAGGASSRRGLRQEGGCRCGIPGGTGTRGHSGLAMVGIMALISALRRRGRSAAG
jgi:hypothetical protein